MSAALLAVLGAVAGLHESLWVDELHTSWTVTGSLVELPQRAQAGNQSSIYFWLLAGLTKTLGHSEWVLRLPSLASFAVCVGLVYTNCDRGSRRSRGRFSAIWILLVVLSWMALERIQLFYATEARVYALLQLLSLLGWLTAFAIAAAYRTADVATRPDAPPSATAEPSPKLMLAWGVLAIFSMHLHLLAGLAVAWQWLFVTLVLVRNRMVTAVKAWSIASLSVAALSLPALLAAIPIWQRRSQWESFAGDASLENLLRLFPILPLLVPLILANSLDRILGSGQQRSESTRGWETRRWGWIVAIAGPGLTAWLVTALDVAPIMHRRYLLCMALPLVMLAAGELLRVRRLGLQVLIWSASIVWLFASQGTFDVWSQGQWLGWLRGEDWRSASTWVQENLEEGDHLWCASGLIEGQSVQWPLEPATAEYLAFPLLGIYRVHDPAGHAVDPQPLVGNSRAWARQWLTGDSPDARPLFVVYRGRLEALSGRLTRIDSVLREHGYELQTLAPPRRFGRVCATKLVLRALPSSAAALPSSAAALPPQ